MKPFPDDANIMLFFNFLDEFSIALNGLRSIVLSLGEAALSYMIVILFNYLTKFRISNNIIFFQLEIHYEFI